MDIPLIVTILDGAFATDGGSIFLSVSDPDGNRHSVLLAQHLLPPWGDSNQRKPGRLYFDGVMLEVRSEDEKQIMSALKQAKIRLPLGRKSGAGAVSARQPGMIVGEDIRNYYSKIEEGPESALIHLVNELIEYVDSDEYVAFALKQWK